MAIIRKSNLNSRREVRDFSRVLSNSNSLFDKVEDWIPVSCFKIKEPTVIMKNKIV